MAFIGFFIAGAALISQLMAGEGFDVWSIFALGGALAILATIAELVWLVYTLWVGLSAGQAGANAYGPAPVRVLAADIPPAPDQPD